MSRAQPTMEQEISLTSGNATLVGDLSLPPNAPGLVLFAHGSGSSRHSPRNRLVARTLARAGLGTLLFDLLTPEEEESEARTGHLRFDVDLLAERLIGATSWALDNAGSRDIPAAYFGSSTGAAAALIAAAELGETISSVVSRGGRPDLAGDALERVATPTLLIVGKNDPEVLKLNEDACARLRCEKALRIIPGASHLFEETGALEMVAGMASEWFTDRFQPMRTS